MYNCTNTGTQVIGASNICSYFCTMMAPMLSPVTGQRFLLFVICYNLWPDRGDCFVNCQFCLLIVFLSNYFWPVESAYLYSNYWFFNFLLVIILTSDCSMSLDRATPAQFCSSPLLEDPYESIFVEVRSLWIFGDFLSYFGGDWGVSWTLCEKQVTSREGVTVAEKWLIVPEIFR